MVFLTIFIITVTLYWKKFIFFLISNPFRELFYFLFIFILLIKIYKTYLSDFSYINIYETIIWLYFYLFVCNLHFLIIKKNFDYSFFNDIFILTAFLSAFLIFISFILYNFGFDYFFLLETKKNVFQPYFGSNSLHFNGFFSNYNMQAYLIVPGIFFTINEIKFGKKLKSIMLIFLLFCLFLTKSKILILVLAFLCLYLVISFLKIEFILRNLFIIIYFFLIFLLYSFLTHFLPLNSITPGQVNNEIFLHYYTEDPIFQIFDYNFYGSLFYKLKVMAISLFGSNDYLFFNEINFKEMNNIFVEYDRGIHPHSEYFGSLSNFGLIGFLAYIIFMYGPLIKIQIIKNKNIQVYTIVLLVFLIEAFVSDILNHQFIWIIFGILISYKNMVAEEDLNPRHHEYEPCALTN